MKDALPEIYKIVDGEYFAPIAYRASTLSDYFFVHDQGKALKRLFEKELRIFVHNQPVDLLVKFCVDRFTSSSLKPRDKISKIIQTSIKEQTANLSRLSEHHLLADVKFLLSNKMCFTMLCEELRKAKCTLFNVRVINLMANEISSLEPMAMLDGLGINCFDLRQNKIASVEEFHFMKALKVQELQILGNSVVRETNFSESIKSILKALKTIDSNEAHVIAPSKLLEFDNRSEPIVMMKQPSAIFSSNDINETVLQTFYSHKNLSWCKVIVHHRGKVSKSLILNEMCRQLFNAIPFYPCYYQQGELSDFFYLHQSFTTLEKLMECKLKMEIQSHKCVLKFELHMDYAKWLDGQIDWRKKLHYVVKKRINNTTLNLDFLADDIDLTDMSVSITTDNGMMRILNIAKKINRKLNSVTMQGNNISRLDGLKTLKDFPNLLSLDLRDNNIQSFENFQEMPKIVELFLDKNPICRNYYDVPWKYISYLRYIFTKLEYLDGHHIDTNTGLVFMQNFLVAPEAYTLTESFIKTYFSLFDSNHRKALKKLYDSKSMFTMSCEPSPNIPDFFLESSRNFIHEYGPDTVFVGEKIISLFVDFPKTSHDFSTLQVDVTMITEEVVMINVNGYFKELGSSLNDEDYIYSFTRTFVLRQIEQKLPHYVDKTFKYSITNDMLLIKTISDYEANKVFKKNIVTEIELGLICKDLLPTKPQEEETNVLMLKTITNLKDDWCKR